MLKRSLKWDPSSGPDMVCDIGHVLPLSGLAFSMCQIKELDLVTSKGLFSLTI